MSLLFGDDVFSAGPLSRAVDEEEELAEELGDTDSLHPSPVLRWCPGVRPVNKQPVEGLQCSSLIIAIGPVATGFVQVYLLESQPSEVIGVICSGLFSSEANSLGQMEPSDKTCFIHRLNDRPDVLCVQCNVSVHPEQSHLWTQQLLSALCLATAHVTVLSTCSLSEYKSVQPSGDLPRNFLRTLHSRTLQVDQGCVLLEQPNTIAGLPAQILTYCEVYKVLCALYICYTDTSNIETDTIRAFSKLLHLAPFSRLTKDNPKLNEQLTRIVHLHTDCRTLYT
jgi:proteasome assembly chaperone 1